MTFSASGMPPGYSGGSIGLSDSSTAGAFFSNCEAMAAPAQTATATANGGTPKTGSRFLIYCGQSGIQVEALLEKAIRT